MKLPIFVGMMLLAASAYGQTAGFGPPASTCAVNDLYQDKDFLGVSWKCGPSANEWVPTPAFEPWGGSTGGATATLENIYASAGSFTFNHNLNALFPQVTCYTRTGANTYSSATWTAIPIDANDTSITVPSAGDYICAFSSTSGLTSGFSVAVSPTSQTFEPTMTGTQQPTFTVSQSAIGGYTGTATYSTSSLASGMTGVFSPTTITGAGSNVLTLSFPASQTPASTTFNVSGNDGSNTHTATPTITVGNINSGLVECWAMNDGSGASYADSCGTGNNATITGSVTWQSNAGLPGTTALLSATAFATGSNQTVTNFTGATAFSASTWASINGSPGQRVLFGSADPSNSFVGWDLNLSNSGSNFYPDVQLINTVAGTNYIEVNCSTSVALAVGSLHYYGFSYDGSKTAAGVKIYVDGTACTTTVASNTLTGSIANTKPVVLGALPGGTLPLNGYMGYTRIWNRIVSATDFANYFAAGAR